MLLSYFILILLFGPSGAPPKQEQGIVIPKKIKAAAAIPEVKSSGPSSPAPKPVVPPAVPVVESLLPPPVTVPVTGSSTGVAPMAVPVPPASQLQQQASSEANMDEEMALLQSLSQRNVPR